MTEQMSQFLATIEEPTLESVWRGVAGGAIDDELLGWPADVFALTELLLERSEVYRFALCPPIDGNWPPDRVPNWAAAVVAAGRDWGGWVEDETNPFPELLAEEWDVFRDAATVPLQDLAEGRDWRTCQALLTVHAIADEACAGLGVALTASATTGFIYRARGRELFARTGSMARIPPRMLRVLPKVRTSPSGSSAGSLSRYACVAGPGIEAAWHKVPMRRPGIEPRSQAANMLLLPWPLRVRGSDFRPVAGSVDGLANQPSGFFEFSPSERFDLDLVDRMLVAAEDEVDGVDLVCLPECALEAREVEGLEELLKNHGVAALITGVRRHGEPSGQLSGNWVHIGVLAGDQWVHIRQNKHHRWSLDEAQIYQYHLGGSLHPRVRWWEAIEIPRRTLQLVEVGAGVTVASVVCEDLAQLDDVADLLHSVGPTITFTPLLDGPQLSSRWAARYASVLADNPGSAVLTLTSFGMAQRSRPHGHEASPVIALWKDPAGGTREIPLEAGAAGVLLSASVDLTTRRSSDGRQPVKNCTEFFDVGICQIQPAESGSTSPTPKAGAAAPPALEACELTILTSWAEALAEALAVAPQRANAVLADAQRDVQWRAVLGIVKPSPQLSDAIDSMSRDIQQAGVDGRDSALGAVLGSVCESRPCRHALEDVARRVLRSAIEQRIFRQTYQPSGLEEASSRD